MLDVGEGTFSAESIHVLQDDVRTHTAKTATDLFD